MCKTVKVLRSVKTQNSSKVQTPEKSTKYKNNVALLCSVCPSCVDECLLSADKKVVGGYRLQTAKFQMEKLQKQQLRVHPPTGDFVPRPPAPPRRVPSSHPPAVHRNRLTTCPSSNQRTEQLSHRAERENLEKLPPLVNPAPSLARCSEILGPWDW